MLRLEGQSLVGSLPGRLKSLEYLYLGVNNLSGMIPPALYNLSSVIELVFTANHLSGNFMSKIRFSFHQLRRFAIAQNQFRGIIRDTLSSISGLDLLDLGENDLRGQVPDSLGMLKNLYWLRLDSNELGSGMLGDLNFLNSFNNISSLRVIGLYSNNFGFIVATR